jgi:putative membrane protein
MQTAGTIEPRPGARGAAAGAFVRGNGLLLVAFAMLLVVFLVGLSSEIGVSNGVIAIVTVTLGFALVLVHGSAALGWHNVLLFVLITIAVSFTAEAVGVATGLVFGDYHHTTELGPRILGVPPVIQLGYIAMGYASSIMARIVLGQLGPARGWSLLLVPLMGTFIMVSCDVAMDPLQSTVAGDWIWEKGGAYFGVGIHNYVGWFGTVFIFLVCYQLLTTRLPETPRTVLTGSPVFWSAPVLFYALLALRIIQIPLVGGLAEPWASPENYTGSADVLTDSLALVACFVMGTPVVTALCRLFAPHSTDA